MNTSPLLEFRPDRNADLLDDSETGGFGFDLRRVWAVAYRNRRPLIVCIFICLLLGVIYLVFATPIYEADASVKIEEQQTQILRASDQAQASPVDAQRFLQTQVDIIRSRSVALAVARDQRLAGNPDFYLKMHLPADSSVPPPNLSVRQAAEDRAVGVLMSHMKVDLPVDSRIATISFRGPDPTLAARIANSFAESYIRTDLQRRFDTSAYARQFITDQLSEAKQQLERSERAALAYSRSARLIDASNGSDAPNAANQTPKSLIVARLVSLNSSYAEAVARRVQAEQKWRQAQGASVMSLPEVLGNQTIQELVQKRALAAADYKEQRQTRKEDYPLVRQAQAQLDELNRQVSTVSGSIRSSLRLQYEAALHQEQALLENIRSLEKDTVDEQQRNVQLSILRRATDTSRSLYDTLLQRYRELNAEAGVQPNNIQLIDPAEIPVVPVAPRRILTLLFGLLAGVVVGVAAVYILEHMNDTVRTGEDVSDKLDLPLLGTVPVVKEIENDLQNRKSTISEAYSSIRTALLLSSRGGLPDILTVTSIQPAEGKTTSSYAIATGLARVGKRVVTIDCDLRRPALHKRFGVGNVKGVTEYLSGLASVNDILQQSGAQDVMVITSGTIPPNPTELLSGPLLAGLLDDLRGRFDTVIIDSPPILGLADAMIVSSLAEGTILVMEAGRNYRGSMITSVNRLRKGGVRFLGAIITKQNMRDLGYAYEQDYQYNYGN